MGIKQQFNFLDQCYSEADWLDRGTKKQVQFAIMEKEEKLIVLFQGSMCFWDWVGNFCFFPKKITPYKDMPYTFQVHGGFWKQFNIIRDEVKSLIDQAMSRKNPPKQIILYGWSLGGALALLAKEMVSFHYPDADVSCVTIGQPRVFCKIKDWEQVRPRLANVTRITNESDTVPYLPFKWLGLWHPFCHIVDRTHVGQKWSFFRMFKFQKWHMPKAYRESINNLED